MSGYRCRTGARVSRPPRPLEANEKKEEKSDAAVIERKDFGVGRVLPDKGGEAKGAARRDPTQRRA